MRAGTAIIMIVALLAGVVAAMSARSIISSARSAAPSVQGTIVIATRPLNFGDVLGPDNVQEAPWGSPVVPEGAFAKISDLNKDGQRVALSSIGKNEPVLESRITGGGQKASLSSLIDQGRRAVTVRVDDVRGVAGFVMPGDRVDVALTRSEKSDTFSDILLQNVKVLAIDQLVNERQEHPTVAKAVTLEVTAEQGQKLFLASGAGTLSLILRTAGDATAEAPHRVTLTDLGRSEAAGPTKAKVENESEILTRIVTVMRGVKAEEVSVRQAAP
jgi:pilus assembly protein CpaB